MEQTWSDPQGFVGQGSVDFNSLVLFCQSKEHIGYTSLLVA